MPTVSANVSAGLPPHVVVLTPPDYDTVCMELPKYEDFVAENGIQGRQGVGNSVEPQGAVPSSTPPAWQESESAENAARSGLDGANTSGLDGSDPVDSVTVPTQAWVDSTERGLHSGSPPPPYEQLD